MKTTSVVMPIVNQSILRNRGGGTGLAGGRGTAWLGAGLPCSFAGFNFSLLIVYRFKLFVRDCGKEGILEGEWPWFVHSKVSGRTAFWSLAKLPGRYAAALRLLKVTAIMGTGLDPAMRASS